MINNRKTVYISIGIVIFISTLAAIFAFRQEAQIQDDVTIIQTGRQKTKKEQDYDKVFARSKQLK